MTFRPEPDVGVADWWLRSQDWQTTVHHGPAGFAAYVRFRHHDPGAAHDEWVLALAAPLLAEHTSTPDDVVVAQGEGNFGGGATLSRDPATGAWVETPSPYVFDDEVRATPRAVLRDGHGSVREYLLLRGSLGELGAWPARPGEDPPGLPELVCGAMWPQDRAWCHVWDTDDDGATVACDESLAAALLADGRYAAWRVGRGEPDPPERRSTAER